MDHWLKLVQLPIKVRYFQLLILPSHGQPPTKILIESQTVNKNHYMTKTAERANTVMCATRIIIALLIHFFLSIGPGKPSTAFFNFQVYIFKKYFINQSCFQHNVHLP